MKPLGPEAFEAFNWSRVFLGDLPWLFLLEIAFRTVFMYLYALVLIRLLGKRGIGQLSPFDFVVIIALGSATGDPMFYKDVPLGYAMVVLASIVGLQRLLYLLTQRNEKIESFVASEPSRLVKDGRLELRNLEREGVSQEELFMALREAGLEQLGQVKRAYLEPSGSISILQFSEKETRHGLPIYPPLDLDEGTTLSAGDYIVVEEDDYACCSCGHVVRLQKMSSLPSCEICSGSQWRVAAPHKSYNNPD